LLGRYVIIFSNLFQPSLTLISQARQRHDYFKRFPHGWAIEEFIKSNLKNKRAYARNRGYLQEHTNTDHVGSDEEDNTAPDNELDDEESTSESGGDHSGEDE